MIWDRGTWEAEGDPHKGLKKGHLSFTLDGEKLHGGWHLVRMHRRPNEKRNNWLLIKQHDEAERGARDKDILEEEPLSVASGPLARRDRRRRDAQEKGREETRTGKEDEGEKNGGEENDAQARHRQEAGAQIKE